MTHLIAAAAAAFLATGALIPALWRAQLIDKPNHRSSHEMPIPRGGGIAVVLTIVLLSVVFVEWDLQLATLLVATVWLAAVGLVDDRRSLSSGLRLASQGAVAVLLGVVFLAEGVTTWLWLPVLVVAVVGYVNAYNFMDGVNGISALTAIVVGGWWAWAGADQGEPSLEVLGLVLAGAGLGFLPWNAPHARIFLGDVGSYGIGVFIAGLSVWAVCSGLPWPWAVLPLLVYGADTGAALLKRFLGGRSLTEAHREHVYQRLVDSGWSHLTSAGVCAVAGAAGCIAAAWAGDRHELLALVFASVVAGGYLALGSVFGTEIQTA